MRKNCNHETEDDYNNSISANCVPMWLLPDGETIRCGQATVK